MRSKLIAPIASLALVIGAVGGSLIKTSEGKVNKTYLDAAGIPTICFGHTGASVKMGQTKTDAECEQLFLADVRLHQRVLTGPGSCVGDALKPGSNRMDAVTSFTFNVGMAKFCKSTMAKHIKAKNYGLASAEFPKWKYATVKGKPVVLKGLVTRRAAEQTLFNSQAPWVPYTSFTSTVRYTVKL